MLRPASQVTDGVKDKQDMLDSLDKGCNCRGKYIRSTTTKRVAGIMCSVAAAAELRLDQCAAAAAAAAKWSQTYCVLPLAARQYSIDFLLSTALGQDEVNVTFTRMTSAQTSVTQAEFSLTTVTTSQVHLASQTYQTLRSGECGWIKEDQSYVSALATHTTAVNTLANVKTLYKLSVEMHTSAVNEAARLALECECRIQSEHEKTWADANEENAANEAAWAQAHHIDCVVQSIAEADCAFSPAPSLTRPTVCDNIGSVSCNEPSGSGSADSTTAAPTDEMVEVGPGCCRFPGWTAQAQGMQTEEECKLRCLEDATCVAADTSLTGPNGLLECHTFNGDGSGLSASSLGCGGAQSSDVCYKKQSGSGSADDEVPPADTAHHHTKH